MKHSSSHTPGFDYHSNALHDYTALTAGRDFVTPDGLLVPRALGEAGLRQHTALLVGGMLVGNWPDRL